MGFTEKHPSSVLQYEGKSDEEAGKQLRLVQCTGSWLMSTKAENGENRKGIKFDRRQGLNYLPTVIAFTDC